MDNQEAIDILGHYDVSNIHFYTTDGEEIPFTEWSDAIEMAISALQAQEAKAQLSAEGTTSDLISRQAAIALANSLKDDLPDDERMVDAVMAHNEGIMEYQTKLSLLPSVQPEIEERTEEFAQNVPKEDLISRKAAIDALDNIKIPRNASWYPYYQQALTVMSRLPSAQPEIVHCRDCMYYGTYYRGNESKPVITHLCKWCLDRTMEPDDYCSHAERRTDVKADKGASR